MRFALVLLVALAALVVLGCAKTPAKDQVAVSGTAEQQIDSTFQNEAGYATTTPAADPLANGPSDADLTVQ